MKNYLFFDLDGTLTDSAAGITGCVVHALKKQNRPIPDDDTLRRFIGPPLIDSFQDITGMNAEQAARAVRDYRERYSTIGLFENRAYDGIIEVLAEVRRTGKHLFIVTSKPEEYSVRIAQRFGLSPYFEQICGATLDGSINEKRDVVAMALRRAGNPAPSEVEMIGDRMHDVEGARANGIECTYVLYGFGTRAEAEAHRAAHIVETIDDLRRHLLSL